MAKPDIRDQILKSASIVLDHIHNLLANAQSDYSSYSQNASLAKLKRLEDVVLDREVANV